MANDPNAQVKTRPYTGAPTFLDQILTSLETVFAGFLLATLVAVPLGVLCGLSPTVNTAINPLVQVFKPVSPLAWLPLVTMVVSALYVSSDPLFPKSFLISAITVTLCSLWPTMINTALGVASIDKDLINVARVLRLTTSTKIVKIVLPSSLPLIFTGLRLSLGVGWMVLIAAEMLAQNPGLGKFVWDEFQNGSSEFARPDHGGSVHHRHHRLRARPHHAGFAGGLHPWRDTLNGRPAMAIIELKSVSKSYGDEGARTRVLNNASLRVEEGEFVAIVGFSGSGKTTLINLMAGLVARDSGEVLFKGKPVKEPGPERGVVFQSYSLMPWLSVRANVALAVDAVFFAVPAAKRRERIARYTEMVGLAHASERKPAELSGGMRQRVAVARALAMDPEVLLLDEPLSALDALTRGKLQSEIEEIWSQEKKTVVMITNDVDEALLLADRIVPLMPGPDASFGPELCVPFARPRERSAMNASAAYKTLRAAVTQYLMDCGLRRTTTAVDHRVEKKPPNVVPLQLDCGPPRAYRDAADTPFEQRYVEFYEVRKDYPTPTGALTVVDGFNLLMRKGEFVSLIGHSGCGKSTVLSMAAGLNELTTAASCWITRKWSPPVPNAQWSSRAFVCCLG